MHSMVVYSKAAMERAMKVQEVILRAMAKKITWWQAAEIIGISDRSMRRWHERLEEFGYEGLFDRRRGQPSPQASSSGNGGAGVGAVSGTLFRSERAAFSREAARGAPDRVELHLGETGSARGRAGGQGAQTRGASQAAGTSAAAGHAAAHRRQPASLVPGRALVRPDRDSG